MENEEAYNLGWAWASGLEQAVFDFNCSVVLNINKVSQNGKNAANIDNRGF